MTAQPKPRPGTLAERAAATAVVVDRFRQRPFDWQDANCWKLAAHQARAMGSPLPPVPRFRSSLGAKRALKKLGCDNAADFLDLHFQRLPAASFALVGDLVVMPDAEGGRMVLGAVCIADGQGNLFGWHEAADGQGLTAIKFAMSSALAAWRL